jgi:hypothetical protein
MLRIVCRYQLSGIRFKVNVYYLESAIWRRSVLLVEETGGHGDNLSQISDKRYYIMDWLFIARCLEPNMSCILRTRTCTQLQ